MKAKDFGYIGLVICAVFCFLIAWLMYSTPAYEPTIIQLDDTFPCKENNSEWIQVDNFTVGESFYICSYVKSNVPELHKQIQIRIYEGKRDLMERPVYYDNIWVSNGEISIPLKTYLYPGSYTVELSSGRKILSTLRVEIYGE
ncbi:hypothetical protein HY772_02375 [Candidatus Woesearchaeota archaeon]|nr:hypothetical protein [Candidatus Woesearchaeota archaeon]